MFVERTIKKRITNTKGLSAPSFTRLVKEGELGNLGFGLYTNRPKFLSLPADETINTINEVLNSYPIPPKRAILSSISLNFCINQLISSTTYVVEVEKEYLQSAFELLKTKLSNVILIKPSKKERINYWTPNAIYLEELFSRSPTTEDGSFATEKLIVDLLFDETIYSLYSGKDIESAIEVICTSYTINYRTLLSYAKRRGKKEQLLNRIRQYFPKEVLEVIKNKAI